MSEKLSIEQYRAATGQQPNPSASRANKSNLGVDMAKLHGDFTVVKIRMPIHVISEANNRDHWSLKTKRRVAQQKEFVVLWRNAKVKIDFPCKVIFTRFGAKLLDSDNLAGAFKFVRDQLAREAGVDDGSPLWKFEYRQEITPNREYFIEIELEF